LTPVILETIFNFIINHRQIIGLKEGKLYLRDILKPVPSLRINIVGQARAGKSTLINNLAKYFREKGIEVELVDIGNIYRAYALWIKEQVDRYGDYVLGSEDEILTHLKMAKVEVFNGTIYLNGKPVSEEELHSDRVSQILSQITKDNPKVRQYLQAQDRRIINNLPKSKWVIISSRGYYPQAEINIFLTADIKERVQA